CATPAGVSPGRGQTSAWEGGYSVKPFCQGERKVSPRKIYQTNRLRRVRHLSVGPFSQQRPGRGQFKRLRGRFLCKMLCKALTPPSASSSAARWKRANLRKSLAFSLPSSSRETVSLTCGRAPRRQLDQSFTSRMTSSSTGEPSGRLATPKTRREERVWSPKTSRSNSDAASATLGCSVNSGVAATYTPSLTMWLTRFNEPNSFFVRASKLSAAECAASRPAFTSRSLPTTPTAVTV